MDPLRENMREWIQEGDERGASFLIIVRDEYYNCDSPIFVFPEQNLKEEILKASVMGTVVSISTLGELYRHRSINPLLISTVEH